MTLGPLFDTIHDVVINIIGVMIKVTLDKHDARLEWSMLQRMDIYSHNTTLQDTVKSTYRYLRLSKVANLTQKIRKEHGLSYRAMANQLTEVLCKVGLFITHQTVRNWEKGTHLPTRYILWGLMDGCPESDWRNQFAQALNLCLDYTPEQGEI